MGKLKQTCDQSPGVPQGEPRLREAFENAEHVFWCNTNRGRAGENSLEQRMHARRFAAAWTWGGLGPEDRMFNYPDHMQRVQFGHLIVMYANELGVIAIGRATEGGLEVLNQNHPDRMRDYATEGENAEEWRIPVEWLVWDEDDPCPVDPLRPSFQEVTNLAARIAVIRQHFRAVQG